MTPSNRNQPRDRQSRAGFGLLGLVVALLVVGGIGYFVYSKFFTAPPAPPAPPPPTVSIKEVAPKDMPLMFEYAGRTAGSREVEIRARVSGILKKRAYVEGDWVKQGQLLFVIDREPFEASKAQASALAASAESDWKRVSELYKEQAVSGREYDAAKALYEQTRAQSRTASINLAYTTVTAPISGVTSKEGLSEGSLVTADSSLLTRLTQLNPLYVDFAYPDTEAMMQRQGVASGKISIPEDKMLRAEIRFGDGTVYPKEGLISFTDSIIDPQTGTMHARVVLENAEYAILPGQFVRVVVKGFVQKNAMTVPDQAIMQSPQGQFVYVVDAENKATMQPVTLGALNGEDRIIEQGLKAGDKVIVQGMIKVKPSQPVNIAAPTPPADTATDAKAAPNTDKPADAPAPSAKKE